MAASENSAGKRLATTLKAARERKLWTQQDLADAAEVTRQTVIRYESGNASNPEAAPLRRVCAALGLDIREVLVDLEYVTREELGLPPRDLELPNYPRFKGVHQILRDHKIPDGDKSDLDRLVGDAHDYWRNRRLHDIREPSAAERLKGKPVNRR